MFDALIMAGLDFRETTLVFDYGAKTVELYTTSRSVFLRAVARNHAFLEAVDLKPGYRVLYPMDQVREAEAVLRKAPASPEFMEQYMTEAELERRATQRRAFVERMEACRKS